MEQAGIVTHVNVTEPASIGTDAECLAAYQQSRSEAAFAAIVERHGAMVFRTCLRLLSNVQEAEDAAQAVFIVLATNSSNVRPTLALWLYDRARDSARVVLKSRLRRQRRESDAGAALRHQAMMRSDSNDLREELDAALARLPANLREALVLRFLEGHRVENSARIAGCSERTFARYCEEGLERLRALLSPRGATTSAAVLALLTQEAAAKVSSSTLAALKATFAGAGASKAAGATAHALTQSLFWAHVKVVLSISTLAAAVALSTPLVKRAFSVPPQPTAVAPVVQAAPAPIPVLTVSADERKMLALQDTIHGSADDIPWERIPWTTDLWTARRLAAEQRKPILLFDSWGHPLTSSSSEGVTARHNIFSDPEVVKLATADFIPCATDDWYLSRRNDDESAFFRQFGHKKNMVSSAIYCIAPDGALLRAVELEAPAAEARAGIRAALQAYAQLPEESKSPRITDQPRQEQQHLRPRPAGTRIVRVFSRTLERDEHGALIPATQGVAPEFTAPGRDNVWLYENEWRALLKKDARVGETIPVPPQVLRRLCRFHLTDYTRGEGIAWEDENVLASALTLTVEEVAGSKVKLRASGSATVASRQDLRRARSGFEARIDGCIEYDVKTERLERFDLIAVGEQWGAGEFNPGARPGRTPLGIAFQLVPDSDELRPADAVPPHGLRSSSDYLCAPAPAGDTREF